VSARNILDGADCTTLLYPLTFRHTPSGHQDIRGKTESIK